MKYLVAVDHCFLDVPGGMGRVAWDIALLMQERGHDVAMVVARPDAGTEAPTLRVDHGIRVVRYSRPVLPGWHPLRAHRTVQIAQAAALRHLGSEAWDLVHLHSPLTALGVLRAMGSGPRYLYTLHSPVVMEQEINWSTRGPVGQLKRLFGLRALQRLERQALEPCSRIHTLSAYSRSKVDYFHGLGHRVTIIPHWPRPGLRRQLSLPEARRRLRWPAHERILFTIRKLGPRYGLDVAIHAVAPLVREGRCVLVIGGEGPMRAELAQLVERLGVSDGIRFTGRLDESQLALAYQAADLFVLPTRALECFGLVVHEALAFGCPVVSTDAGALPELMRPILPEFIVPAGDADALRARLDLFLSGRLKAPPPEALVAHVDRLFSRNAVAPKMLALLEGDAPASTLTNGWLRAAGASA